MAMPARRVASFYAVSQWAAGYPRGRTEGVLVPFYDGEGGRQLSQVTSSPSPEPSSCILSQTLRRDGSRMGHPQRADWDWLESSPSSSAAIQTTTPFHHSHTQAPTVRQLLRAVLQGTYHPQAAGS